MIYKESEQITMFDSVYLVEKVYKMPEENIIKYKLNYKIRVKLRKISGDSVVEIMDFAVREGA